VRIRADRDEDVEARDGRGLGWEAGDAVCDAVWPDAAGDVVVEAAAERLEQAGPLEDGHGYDSWRIDEAALAAASTSGV